MDDLLTLQEVAKRLHIAVGTVRRKLLYPGVLVGHLVGGQWRVREDDLEAYLRTTRAGRP